MSEEKIKILEMIKNGKITPEEGIELLDALNDSETSKVVQLSPKLSERMLVVKVNGPGQKVNVNVPLNLLKVASKFVNMGMGFIPAEARREMENKGIDISKFDFEELVDLFDRGLTDGKLVDVESEDDKGVTKVEVYVE